MYECICQEFPLSCSFCFSGTSSRLGSYRLESLIQIKIIESPKTWSRYITDYIPNYICESDLSFFVLSILVLLVLLLMFGLLCIELHIHVDIHVVILFLCGLLCYNT